jgi:hypothetical protein
MALIPLATEISALAMLALLATILVALVAIESKIHSRYRQAATSAESQPRP